jgi:toxin-antitoxin system PIN domain toxin
MPKSTKSFLFPDVNVWIALTYDGHVHHRAATKWFQSLGTNARLFFCRVTQLGLLRLLTTEAVMGKEEVLSQAEAWDAYNQWLLDERVTFLAEPPGIEESFRASSRSARPSPKDWADSYLVAFAATSNLTLVTFDRALKSKAEHALLLTP